MPCVIVVGLHDVHDRAAEPDDARCTAEQHAGIGAEDLGKELGSPLFLGDSRQLPCIVEDKAQRREDGGQEVAGGEQAAPCVAAVAVEAVAHLTHKEQIGGVDDPEAYLGRYHGQREVETAPQATVTNRMGNMVPSFSLVKPVKTGRFMVG